MAYIISKQNNLGKDKRYNLFKSALFLSLKAKDFKYEDHLRSLFGKHVNFNNEYRVLYFQHQKKCFMMQPNNWQSVPQIQ